MNYINYKKNENKNIESKETYIKSAYNGIIMIENIKYITDDIKYMTEDIKKEWIQIDNVGQCNNGIYIKDKFVMKHTTIKEELLKLGISEPIKLKEKIEKINMSYIILPNL